MYACTVAQSLTASVAWSVVHEDTLFTAASLISSDTNANLGGQ